ANNELSAQQRAELMRTTNAQPAALGYPVGDVSGGQQPTAASRPTDALPAHGLEASSNPDMTNTQRRDMLRRSGQGFSDDEIRSLLREFAPEGRLYVDEANPEGFSQLYTSDMERGGLAAGLGNFIFGWGDPREARQRFI